MDNDCGWLRENDMYINSFILRQVIVLNMVIFWSRYSNWYVYSSYFVIS